jgi:predicted DNA-binding transcriptional regulator AlpA
LARLAARVRQASREDLPQVVADRLAVEAECQRLRALAWTRIMSATIEERLYSVRDLAARWALSRPRIYELIGAKDLPAVRIDRVLRVRHRDVLAFEAVRTTTCQDTSLSASIDP